MELQQFIDSYLPYVIKVTNGTGIFPGTVMTQVILESSKNGRPLESLLTVKANNAFGVKAFSSWKGKRYNIATKEYKPGSTTPYTENDDFRAYNSIQDSINDYLTILKKHSEVINAKTLNEQFAAVSKFYATDPNYEDKLYGIFDRIMPILNTNKAKISGGVLLVGIALITYYLYSRSQNPKKN